MPDALKKADEVLQQAVQGITDLINLPALINLDFADVQTVMKDKGMAHIGIGNAKGDEKAIEAVKLAIASPLLETTINGASHVIINISGDISLMDANDAASYVQDLAGEDANIIFGAKYDETMTDEATAAGGWNRWPYGISEYKQCPSDRFRWNCQPCSSCWKQ